MWQKNNSKRWGTLAVGKMKKRKPQTWAALTPRWTGRWSSLENKATPENNFPVQTIVPSIPQVLHKYWLTSENGLGGPRCGFCRGHAHILQIAGKFAHSACDAGMHKTEEAENRKGGHWPLPALGEDGSRFTETPHKKPLSVGTQHCHLACVLNRGHFFSRFLGELEAFSLHSTSISKSTPSYILRGSFDGCWEKSQLNTVPCSTCSPPIPAWLRTHSFSPWPNPY